MKKLLIFAVAVFFFVNFSSLAADLANFPRNFIVAKINNKAVTNSELNDRYRFVLRASKMNVKIATEKKILLEQILDKMIEEELIRQEAANLKIEASRDEIRDAVDLVALQQKKNATQFKLFFISGGVSFDNYLKQVEAEILWSKIISDTLRSRVKVTEVEVKEFFEQHKFNTDVKRFLIAEIVIPQSENAAELANKLTVELKSGADFRTIVEQFSHSISAENHGELGWVSQADIEIGRAHV